jgi:hypothetical protein
VLTTRHLSSAKVGINFADKQRSLSQSVGIVRLRTQAMEFSLVLVYWVGVRLSSLGMSATNLPIVSAPDDK